MTNRKLKEKRMLTFFIEAAQEIMVEEGINAITLRKVADIAGYNGATLYNYFKDLDHLILFASLKYLKLYNLEVVRQLKNCKNEREKLIMMWETFCKISFKNPQPFYQIFFNKHSGSLESIIKKYYELFPEDIGTKTKDLQPILAGAKLDERNKIAIIRIAKEENQSWINIDLMNEMMIALYHDLILKRISDDSDLLQDFYENKMLAYVNFILNHKD